MPNAKLLHWKVDTTGLFAEILNNPGTAILRQPLIITDSIIKEGAAHAIKLGDEQMISIFARLGMYEGCNNKKHPDYKKLTKLTNKVY
ncbi:MAG: hypothetical protein V4538_15425 [Bacteroidota bacterium]